MRVEYINPFVTSLKNTFQTMLNCDTKRGQVCLQDGSTSRHPVSGVIGLTGKAVGTVVLNLSENVALKAAATLLLTEMPSINDEVLDAVGELTNMVTGAAKAELEEYELKVSLPNVITGANHEIHFPSDVTPVCVPFETEWGKLTLEVGLAPVEEEAIV
ncbi:MAG: chemotaxis protein CheX [Pirellulales bacterium]|nr:chemotaxis protein CheX [Pirellulales bacterium]